MMMKKHNSINIDNGELGRREREDFSPDHHGGLEGGSGGGAGGSGLKKGPWTAGEDAILTEYVKRHGEGNWNAVQKNSGLARCGKSCRLRWANHLRPNLKKGSFSPEEEHLILELHSKLGNKWARMAAQLPGRTDNEIKNYWNTRVKRRQRAGLPLYPENLHRQSSSLSFHLPNQNQSRSSSSQQHFSSFQQQKQPSFNSPFSLFNPNNTTISTPPFALQFHEYKRYRANSNFGFSLPFSSNDHAQPPSSLFSQNHSSQLQPSSNVGYHFGNFELNPSPMQRSSFEPDELGGSSSDFSLKLELPSIQLPDEAVAVAPNLGSAEGCNLSSQSYLLDALLQQAQTMANGGDAGKREKRYGFDQFAQDAPTSESAFNLTGSNPSESQCSFGLKSKEEPKEVINSGDDDLSSLFNIVPPPMPMGEWGYSTDNNSGEISNGPSSGVTEDDVGLDQMKQQSLVSSMPNTNSSEQDYWNDTWNNMPGIC